MSKINYMTRPIRQTGRIHDIKDWSVGELKHYDGGLIHRFSSYCSNEHYPNRLELCEKLRSWLLKLSKTKIHMEILIGGAFITRDPAPVHVDVVCIFRQDASVRNLNSKDKDLIKKLLVDKKYIDMYRCSIAGIFMRSTPRCAEDDKELYNEALNWFNLDKKYKSTIFRVIL